MDAAIRQIDLPVGECVRRGWDLAIKNLGPLLGYTIIVLAISIALGLIPILGAIATIVISPALSAGYFIYTRKSLRGEATVFGDFFGGFDYLGQLFLYGLVGGLLVAIGLVLCIIPGLYLAIGYMFASFLIVAKRMDFWAAMETSRKVVTANIGSVIVLILLQIAINILGLLACGVGLIISIPVSYCAGVVAYQMLFEEEVPPIPAAGPVTIG